MDIAQIGGLISQFGAGTALFVLAVAFFWNQLKRQDTQLTAQMAELKAQAGKREELQLADFARREEQYKERERIIVAEFAQREGIFKQESEKREGILRAEAQKREATLLAAIEGFGRTMKEISATLTAVKNSMGAARRQLDDVEAKLEAKGAPADAGAGKDGGNGQ